jgi:voltage-gated potassium channel
MRFKGIIRRRPVLTALACLVVFFCSTVIFVYKFEDTEDILDAFRIVFVLYLGEYENFGPKTIGGKIISIVSLLIGVAIVATFIGKIASLFVHLKGEVKMPKNIGEHIVICNWNNRGDRIIREIHSPLAEPETEIVVIAKQEIEEEELRMSTEYEKVFFIRSDPTLHRVLKKARAHLAKSAIILASDECSDPDGTTALISLAITKLEKDLPRKPHIVAEVINHNKTQHLLDAGVDEWVCSSDYGLGIIAQCALYGKLSDVYQQLLTYSKDTNEIYMVDGARYPEEFVGLSFIELTRTINERRNPENPIILVGIKRDEKVIMNPKPGEFDALREGDSLIVMSFDQPALRHLTK